MLGWLKQCHKMELKTTFTAISKEEKDDSIRKLREDSSNLEMECGDRNMKDNIDNKGAV